MCSWVIVFEIWQKTWEVLLFVTWLKMGDCEESKDDRTGANHCDNNLKSSRHDIFPIMLPKMSTLWRTVRKWFAENLKGRFERCSSCQMQYSPQLGEKGSPCSGDGSLLAGPSRHPLCSKNGYGWPVACLKFAGAQSRRAACCLCHVWVLCGPSGGNGLSFLVPHTGCWLLAVGAEGHRGWGQGCLCLVFILQNPPCLLWKQVVDGGGTSGVCTVCYMLVSDETRALHIQWGYNSCGRAAACLRCQTYADPALTSTSSGMPNHCVQRWCGSHILLCFASS